MRKLMTLLAVLVLACSSPTAPEAPALDVAELGPLHMGDVVLYPYGSVPPIGEGGWYIASYGGRVHDANHNLVEGATIRMALRSEKRNFGTSACVTRAFNTGDVSCANAGSFKIAPPEVRTGIVLTLRVTGVEKAGHTYDEAANHDDNGGSDGTVHSVVIR